MRYLIVLTLLTVVACDGSTTPAPKIAAPQREALDRAKGVEQVIRNSADENRQKVDDATK